VPDIDVERWVCPLPLRDHDRVVMGHGGGGRLSAELIEHMFLDVFGHGHATELLDAAILPPEGGRLAFSTDSYVVRPLFFPGGCIGDLAVHGTVNDLSMTGARPIALSAGFILEEGLPMQTLADVVIAMGQAAGRAGVEIVTGDTKVVDVGHADGVYINTAGIGVIADGVDIRPSRATPGDVVIVSGPIGQHGIAVLSKRSGIEFGTEVRSDSAALNGLVQEMLTVVPDLHVLRDPTRGGLGASLCEIAATAQVGIEYAESAVPVPDAVAGACSFLGLDPMHVANEGRLVAMVAATDVDALLGVMTQHEESTGACVIGFVTEDHPGLVVAKTAYGSRRVVDLPLGEQLPRIC